MDCRRIQDRDAGPRRGDPRDRTQDDGWHRHLRPRRRRWLPGASLRLARAGLRRTPRRRPRGGVDSYRRREGVMAALENATCEGASHIGPQWTHELAFNHSFLEPRHRAGERLLLAADGQPEAGEVWVFVPTETAPGGKADTKYLVAIFVKAHRSRWGLSWNDGAFAVPIKTCGRPIVWSARCTARTRCMAGAAVSPRGGPALWLVWHNAEPNRSLWFRGCAATAAIA
jgi:hypothetical protein